ncbi:MAG: alginate export family protein [Candidatus Omnitrophota bacterium]
MKFVKFALVLAIALSLTASVYAETQSVKVSGDLTVRGLWRNDYEYRGSTPQDLGNGGPVTRTGFNVDSANMAGVLAVPGPNQSWWMSTTEVQIDADLTDNVATVIRLANERDWNVQNKNIAVNTTVAPNGLGGYTARANDFDVGVDLAYVKLKNFIYSPLTVSIGRQDLWFGKGFIVGSNHVFNNWQMGQDTNLNAPEYTTFTAFDSIKATLDYDPWTITGIYSAVLENAIGDNDDVDLWGLNVGYKFDNYKAEAEGYWFFKGDNSLEKWDNKHNNDVSTIGVRGSFDPIDSVTVAGEIAYQFGSYVGARDQLAAMDRSAWATDISAEWRGLMDKCAWKPKLGIEYIYYSGDDQTQDNDLGIGMGATRKSGTYTGWDPMFRGKFDSAIREFVGSYYATYDYQANPTGLPSAGDASFTNQNQLIFSGSVQPIESVTIKGNANMFWTATHFVPNMQAVAQRAALGWTPVLGNTGDQTRKGYIGTEFDIQTTWDYTEDVSFGLLTAWFVPSREIYKDSSSVASDIVGTCKVSF